MDLARVLAAFDDQVRAHPPAREGRGVVRDHGVVRLTGEFNFISWWDADTAHRSVARLAAEARPQDGPLVWRVYDHDRPSDLGEHLARHGFQPNPPGSLMLFDLAQALDVGPPTAVEVRRVADRHDLEAFVRAADLAFDDQVASGRLELHARRLGDPDLAMFVVWKGEEPVASARLETGFGPGFGLMFGGGVAPAHRGLGAYRALVAARVEAARALGLSYLATDARETSRPVLQRMGFAVAGRETTWVREPSDG